MKAKTKGAGPDRTAADDGRVAGEDAAAIAGLPDAKVIRRAAEQIKKAADPTRVGVLILLHAGAFNVNAMARIFGTSQPALSHHLAMLRHGGLIYADRRGKENYYRLTDLGRGLAEITLRVTRRLAGPAATR